MNNRKCESNDKNNYTHSCSNCEPECPSDCEHEKHCKHKKCPNQNQGCTTSYQGDQSQTQGDQTETLGDLTSSQGDQTETLGDLTSSQGDLSQTQGDQTETLGDLTSSQGDLSQTQGDVTETLGDQTTTQGDLNQGDQTQSQDETQGSQTQGDQTQTMSGHGGQTQGDFILSNNPNISSPITLEGLTFNLTMPCCDEINKQKNKCKDCRELIENLLRLIQSLALSQANPAAAQIGFFSTGLASIPTVGNITNITNCLFTLSPVDGSNAITVATDTLNALSIESSETTPDLFSSLLAYLQTIPNADIHNSCNNACNCCLEQMNQQLYGYYLTNTLIKINLDTMHLEGYIYKISNCIVYLVDDLTAPTTIFAIPICKIRSFQPQ